MKDAIWLSTTIFGQYFLTLGSPLSVGLFSIVANCGMIALIAAATLGFPRRQYSLFWFLVPLAGSQVFMAVAGFFRGDAKGQTGILNSLVGLSLNGFLLLQIGLVSYFIIREKKGRRLAAVLAGIFVMTYALIAVTYGAMSFYDVWI